MKKDTSARRKRYLSGAILFGLLLLEVLISQGVSAFSTINNTKHDLSATSLAPIRALTETRICVFCHTPHNAVPNTPLWNRQLSEGATYLLYNSPTMYAKYSDRPSGTTKLCLSCHDGSVSNVLGDVLRPQGGIVMLGATSIPSGSLSDIGTDLRNDHPVSFSFQDSSANPEIISPNGNLTLYGEKMMLHCTTCHDPHNDTHGKFLVMDTRGSALCVQCHDIPGWQGSLHNTSACSVAGFLPAAPKTWPTWPTLGDWGCEGCHTMHGAQSNQYLLNAPTEGETCNPCHGTDVGPCQGPVPSPPHASSAVLAKEEAIREADNSSVAAMPTTLDDLNNSDHKSGRRDPACNNCHDADIVLTKAEPEMLAYNSAGAEPGVRRGRNIVAQMRKISSHDATKATSLRNPKKLSEVVRRDVTCSDCHNAHAVNRNMASTAAVGGISGALAMVSGMDRDGVGIPTADYEYEICFKCHADFSSRIPFIPRVVNSTNSRQEFDTTNPSYHPVTGMGREFRLPSLNPPNSEPWNLPPPGLTASSIILCTDCHGDDSGSRGPHGSNFSPILSLRYETTDNTRESSHNYALCYRCHNRNNILSDASFQKTDGRGGHSGHLSAGAPCSACHDAHGIVDDGLSGSHTHLINFDTRIVLPHGENRVPIFNDLGNFSGSCTLVCHGRTHENETYPQGSLLQKLIRRPAGSIIRNRK